LGKLIGSCAISKKHQTRGKTVQPPPPSPDITKLERAEGALRRDRRLLEAIHHAQTQFILAKDPLDLFQELLKSLVALTDSEYGFVDEMFYTEDGRPYLTARGITDISWNDESRKMYQQFLDGTLNFDNLKSLYGVVMSSGKPLIANDAAHDPRRTGTPPGHPPLKAFLGLPLLSSAKEFVGMIGLANRPGGYTEEVVTYLEPMVAASANLIAARKNDQRRRDAEQELQQHKDHLEVLVEERTAALEQRTEELSEKLEELELFNKITVGRELKMIELKREINELCKQSGNEPKYKLSGTDEFAEGESGEQAPR